MTNTNLQFPILPTIIAACGYILIVAYGFYWTSEERKRTREELKFLREEYFTACAGETKNVIPAKEKSIPLKYSQFRDHKGKIIDPQEYFQFIVKGNSMSSYGINDKDLIFVARDFKQEDLCTFPVSIVLPRDNAFAMESPFEVKRAWGVCEIGRCNHLIENVLKTKEFQNMTAVLSCIDGEEIPLEKLSLENLKNSLNKCCNLRQSFDNDSSFVVCTTKLTDSNKILLSLHPVSSIVGIVRASFPV